jgi:hypothetical protein
VVHDEGYGVINHQVMSTASSANIAVRVAHNNFNY